MPQPVPSTDTPPQRAEHAAPPVLLAQTRQAVRDNAHAQADAAHREDLAQASIERQSLANQQTAALAELLDRNTQRTEMTHELSRRIEQLSAEIHAALVGRAGVLRAEVAGPAGGGARP